MPCSKDCVTQWSFISFNKSASLDAVSFLLSLLCSSDSVLNSHTVYTAELELKQMLVTGQRSESTIVLHCAMFAFLILVRR